MDILRENIGLLQLPQDNYYYEDEDNINEGFLGFGKKKSRWQRFKDAIGRNKLKIAAGAALLGAGAWTGRSRYNYNKAVEKQLGGRGYKYDKSEGRWIDPDDLVDIETHWNPLRSYSEKDAIPDFTKRTYTKNNDGTVTVTSEKLTKM